MSKIRVELQLEDGTFTTGVLRAGQTLAQFRRELTQTSGNFARLSRAGMTGFKGISRANDGARTLLGTLRDVSVVAGMAGLAFGALTGQAGGLLSSIISVNAEMERLQYQMIGMSRSADPFQDAADNVAYLREMVRQTPFALNTLAGSFTKLLSTGTDPLNGSLAAITDGIAALGGTDQQLQRVVLGISQISGKGVLQMEELRQQIGESMPGAMAIFARSMGLTMGELVDAVGTGCVEAQSALTAFYEEVNRMYGGEAARMMNTFSGQLAQLTANWQLLVTEEDGAQRFFVAVREVMFDLNAFLQTDRVRDWANTITDGLIGLINAGRMAASMLGSMRGELVLAMQVLAGATAFAVAGRAVAFLTTNINLLRLSMVTGVRAFGDMLAAISLFASGMMVAGQRVAAAGILISGGGAALIRMASVAVSVAFPLAALGIAVFGTASYFGLMSNKTREAYEELRRYGAESREEARRIVADRRAQIEAQLASLERERERYANIQVDPNDPEAAVFNRGPEIEARINHLQGLLRETIAEGEGLINNAGIAEGEAALSVYQRQLSERERLTQSQYRLNVATLDEQYRDDLSRAQEEGRSIIEIREKYQEDLLELDRQAVEARIELYDTEIEATAAASESAGEDQIGVLNRRLDFLREARQQAMVEWNQINDRTFGVNLIDAPESDSARIERGGKALANLREEVEGLEMALEGGSSAYAEMQARINRGFYGNALEDRTGAVRELHQALLDATMQKEILDGLMEGRKALNNDVDNLRDDLAERQEELAARRMGRELTEAERIQLRLNRGFYTGLGSADNLRNAVMQIIGAMNIQGEVTSEVGRALRDDAFGNATLTAIAQVREQLQGIVTDMHGIGSASGNLGLDRLAERVGVLNVGSGGMQIPQGGSRGYVPLPGDVDYIRQNQINPENNRNQPISNQLAEAMSFLREMGIVMEVFSGGQDGIEEGPNARRLGSVRHDHGNAADVYFYQNGRRLDFNQNQADIPIYQEIVRRAMAAGLTGFGAANGYMGSGSMHLGFGAPGIWGGSGANSGRPVAPWLAQAWAAGPLDGPVNQAGTQQPVPAQPAPAPAAAAPAPYNSARVEALIAQLDADRVAYEAGIRPVLDNLSELETSLRGDEQRQDLADFIADNRRQMETMSATDERMGQNLQRAINAIQNGDFGNRDVNAPEYAELLELMRQMDAEQERIRENSRLQNEIERENERLLEQAVDTARELEDARRRAADPDWVPEPSEIARLNRELDTYVQNVERVHGADSPQARDAISLRSQLLSDSRRAEALSRQADMQSETRDALRQTMTRTQQRQAEYQDAMRALDQWVEYARAAGLEEVEITRVVEEQRAAIRQRFAAQSPMQTMMRDWGDLMGNLQEQSARAMSSMAGGITDLLMGTGDLRQVASSILREYVNIGVRYMMSMGKGQAGGAAGKAGKTGGGAFGKMGSALGKMAPVAHSGGIAGRSTGARAIINPLNFVGAPKFHTGGIVGGLAARSLRSDEIPIIAQKGEGVFTPEQMQAMGGIGGGQSIAINAPMTFNAQGGSHDQNMDLADQLGKVMERQMRGVVIEELRRQMRPGNMMKGR